MSVTNRADDWLALLPIATLAGGVAAWWLATVLLAIPSFVLPSPVTVAARLLENPILYLRHTILTVHKIVVGGSIGIVGGFLLGTVVAHVPPVKRAIYPYLVAVRVLPKIAIAPLFLIYIGVGFQTAVLFVALIAFFPMVVSTTAGYERVSDRQLAIVRSVNADPLRTLILVRLPYALPDVFAGLKQSVTLSVIGAIVAEWIVADDGLGFIILVASENVRPDVMIAALSMLIVVGLLLYASVDLLQRRFVWTR